MTARQMFFESILSAGHCADCLAWIVSLLILIMTLELAPLLGRRFYRQGHWGLEGSIAIRGHMSQKGIVPLSPLLGHTAHLASLCISSSSVGQEGSRGTPAPKVVTGPISEVALVPCDLGLARQMHLSAFGR